MAYTQINSMRASTKQVEFIEKLIDGRVCEPSIVGDMGFVEPLTKSEASIVIEALLKLPWDIAPNVDEFAGWKITKVD